MIRKIAPTAALVLLVSACAYTYLLEIPETRTQSAAGVTDISVESKNGRIAIAGTGDTTINMYITRVAWGRNEEDARKAIANVVVTNSLVGSELQLKAEMPAGNRNYGASFQVISPPAVGLTLATNNSEITVSSMTRSVTATTTNGRIGLTGTRGPAVLNTTNGEISVLVHEGS